MKRSGFTLVEVALAMLVIGIGIMGVFGLFPAGIEAGRKTVNETQAALFAEEVFSGYRAMSGVTNWLAVSTLQVPIAAAGQWAAPERIVPGGTQTSVQRSTWNTNLTERSIRYNLTIRDSGSFIKILQLRVYPGAQGGTTEYYDFYTELYRSQP